MSTAERRAKHRPAMIEMATEDYERVVAELEEAQAKVTTLTEERRELLHVLRWLDPDNPAYQPAKPGPKSKPKSTRDTSEWTVSEEKLTKIAEWLKANQDNGLADGFTGTGLYKRADFLSIGSAETVRRAMPELAERGIIRLDRLGQGGSKVYKLTEEAQ